MFNKLFKTYSFRHSGNFPTMKSVQSYFEGRKLLIASMHKKEMVIAPILEKNLLVQCEVPQNFDTDVFGTFTGEIERVSDPITTLRNKCETAAKKYNCDLVVASEGSFGPHPHMFFQSANDEMVMLLDKKHNLEISARELNCDTNFSGKEIKSETELNAFTEQVGFPEHAVILRKNKDDFSYIKKGISNQEELLSEFSQLIHSCGAAYIETDMRAMFNPARMNNIQKAVHKLIEKINKQCPNCSNPGFSVTHVKTGLPCSLCGSSTDSVLSHIYECRNCKHFNEVFFPNGKQEEDPMYCQYCNP